MSFEALVGTTASWNLLMVMARTFPPFLRPKLFHVNASSPKSKSPNGL
ncbi:unnamed protein product [Penicillium nalgiovense]|nr:unnamed protein product [Penicillium nalgiovense]CAG8265775.1 unnamed protein product [Penicillium nalgiovense]